MLSQLKPRRIRAAPGAGLSTFNLTDYVRHPERMVSSYFFSPTGKPIMTMGFPEVVFFGLSQV